MPSRDTICNGATKDANDSIPTRPNSSRKRFRKYLFAFAVVSALFRPTFALADTPEELGLIINVQDIEPFPFIIDQNLLVIDTPHSLFPGYTPTPTPPPLPPLTPQYIPEGMAFTNLNLPTGYYNTVSTSGSTYRSSSVIYGMSVSFGFQGSVEQSFIIPEPDESMVQGLPALSLGTHSIFGGTIDIARINDRTTTTLQNIDHIENPAIPTTRLSIGDRVAHTTLNFFDVNLSDANKLDGLHIASYGGEINIGSADGAMPSEVEANSLVSGTNRSPDNIRLTSVINVNPNSSLILNSHVNFGNNANRVGYMNVKDGYVRFIRDSNADPLYDNFYLSRNNGEGIAVVSGSGRIDSDSMIVGGNNDGSIGRLSIQDGGVVNIANVNNTARHLHVGGNNRGFYPSFELEPGDDPHDSELVDNQGLLNMTGGEIHTESGFIMGRGNTQLNLSGGTINIGVEIDIDSDGFFVPASGLNPTPPTGANNTAFAMTDANLDGGLAYVHMTGGTLDLNGYDVASGRGESIFHFAGGEIQGVQDWTINGDKTGQYADLRNRELDPSVVPDGYQHFILDFNKDDLNPRSTSNDTLPIGGPDEMSSFSTDFLQIGHDNDATLVIASETIYLVRHSVQLGASERRIDARDNSTDDHEGTGELYIGSNSEHGVTGQFHVLGDLFSGPTGGSVLTLDDTGTDGIDWAGRGVADPDTQIGNAMGINHSNFHIQVSEGDTNDSVRREVKRDRRVVDGQAVKFTVNTGNIDVDHFNIGYLHDATYTHTQGLIQVDVLHLAEKAGMAGTFTANVIGEQGQAVFGKITSGEGTSTVNISSAEGDFLVGQFTTATAGPGHYLFDDSANRFIANTNNTIVLGQEHFNFTPGDISINTLNIGVIASTSYTQAGGSTQITTALNLGHGEYAGRYLLSAGTLDLHGADINFANEESAFQFTGGKLTGLSEYATSEAPHALLQSGGTLYVDTQTVIHGDYTLSDQATLGFDLTSDLTHLFVEGSLDLGHANLMLNFEDPAGQFFIPQNHDAFNLISYTPGVLAPHSLFYNGQALIDDGTLYAALIDGHELQFKYLDANNILSIEFINELVVDLDGETVVDLDENLADEPGLLGDFNDDALLTLADIDLLSAAINSGENGLGFDLNFDGEVDAADGNFWLSDAIYGSLAGDFDIEFAVTVADLIIWAENFGSGTLFSEGDTNFDGQVDVADLIVWAQQFGQTGVGPAPLILGSSSIPEPSAILILGAALLAMAPMRRSRRRG